uniref:Uncharacterized protein n=1 Tax=Pristionchus pacificus TaxID=54126 RepID=A0A2A6D0P1_PRIPA|eukprot:PDM83916.1 hypothetical protein PRIPAC_34108 [Pristionchus pacificus]
MMRRPMARPIRAKTHQGGREEMTCRIDIDESGSQSRFLLTALCTFSFLASVGFVVSVVIAGAGGAAGVVGAAVVVGTGAVVVTGAGVEGAAVVVDVVVVGSSVVVVWTGTTRGTLLAAAGTAGAAGGVG